VALKIPAGTVKSRLANARKELKELWQKHFE
jgi:DNA-directed RNA polymerase specialized sigma24 family protein